MDFTPELLWLAICTGFYMHANGFQKKSMSLDEYLKNNKDMKILNLSYNNITSIPSEIVQLVNLEELDLSNNNITSIPKELDLSLTDE